MTARTAPAWTLAAGSDATRELDPPHPVQLDCGRGSFPVRVACETHGALSAAPDNGILAELGAAARDGAPGDGLGGRDAMIEPCRPPAGPLSPTPAAGRPCGSGFPRIHPPQGRARIPLRAALQTPTVARRLDGLS